MNLLSLGFVHLIATATLGGTGIPLGMPPTPEDPMLARVAPGDCLFYMSWAGIASPDPKSRNQTEQLLAEPEIQNFLTQLDRCIGKYDSTVELLDVARMTLSHPTAVFLSKLKLDEKPKSADARGAGGNDGDKPASSAEGIGEIEAGIVISLGKDAKRFKEALDKALDGAYSEGAIPQDIQIDGQPWIRVEIEPKLSWTWGFHGNYFIAAVGDKAVEAILERIKQDPPKWWSSIQEELPIERRSTLTYVNIRAILDLALSQVDSRRQTDAKACLEMLGLANASSWMHVSGLDGADFVNRTLLKLDGEPDGLLRLVSDRPLRPEDLASIPRDSTTAIALRLDLQKALDIVFASIEKMNPETRTEATRAFEAMEGALGVDLRHSILDSLGDTWCIYNSPGEGGFVLTGLTAVVPLRAKPGFSAAYSRLLGLAKQHLAPDPNAAFGLSPRMEQFRFEGRDVYCLNIGVIAPAMSMTDSEMVFALSPQNVKAFLSRGASHESIQRMPRVAGLFAGADAPVMITYCDSSRFFELFYPILTFYSPAIVAGLRDAKMDVDLSLIPSAASIGRHLRPSLTTLRRSKHGIELTSRETVPMPNMTALWLLIAMGTYGDSVGKLESTLKLPGLEEEKDSEENSPEFQDNTNDKEAGNNKPTPGLVTFEKPEGMMVRWDDGASGKFNSQPLVAPNRHTFPVGSVTKLMLAKIPGRDGVEMYPTLELRKPVPQTRAFLAHNAIPVQFTPEDFDQVLAGNDVVKVLYLPDPEFQELSAGVDTIVSTRLEPETDPLAEADRRGAIIAVLRFGEDAPPNRTANAKDGQ